MHLKSIVNLLKSIYIFESIQMDLFMNTFALIFIFKQVYSRVYLCHIV